jgi:hypothetical protein
MLAGILDPPFVKKQYCHINSDLGSGQDNFLRALKNYFSLSEISGLFQKSLSD